MSFVAEHRAGEGIRLFDRISKSRLEIRVIKFSGTRSTRKALIEVVNGRENSRHLISYDDKSKKNVTDNVYVGVTNTTRPTSQKVKLYYDVPKSYKIDVIHEIRE